MPQTAAAPAIAVELDRVSKFFGAGEFTVRALEEASIGIRENEFFTLLGPSGCGKTTILRLIAGFEHPTGGRIKLHGEDIAHLPPFRRPVNTVFQSYALFPHMTVGENVGFGLEMIGRPKEEVAETVDAMLALVRMEALKNRRTSQISGGQQQRVALARALAPRPKVLLLDEPLSALDLKLRKEMQLELKRLQAETGITFIFVTHDQEEALTMSDRVAVMSAGRILQVGPPQEIYEQPAERFVADFIGETNFLVGDLASRNGRDAVVALPGGARVTASLPSGGLEQGDGKVTIVVRPEHARLTAPGEDAALRGRLKQVVYFGTDTHFHVEIDQVGPFIVRMQNSRSAGRPFESGAEVGVAFDEGAAQVLRD